ncbi:proteasome assembly chaperone 1-like [Corticium candelabrum]|uniref:proteasome assembly chaperone 1-like n=1 Tax=Corticium candelabrum TaxID=121492 RepID=UPI002E265812|nr:proteasome assembly chaperone 1-like [Corticium candelabrum]
MSEKELNSVFRFHGGIALPIRCSTLVCGLDPFASVFLRGSLIGGPGCQLIGSGVCTNDVTSGNSFRQDQPTDKCCNIYRIDSEEESLVACTFTFADPAQDWANELFSCIVPGRVLVFCTMAYQYFRVTDPLSETTPFLRLCCYPDSVKEFQRTREVCPRLEAPNELTGASGLVVSYCQHHSVPLKVYVCVTDSPRPDRQTMRRFLSAYRATPQLNSFAATEQDVFKQLPNVESDTPMYI